MPKILIPDGADFIALHVIHCLSHLNDARFYIASSEGRLFAGYSKLCHKFIAIQKNSSEEKQVAVLLTLVKKFDIDIIFPTGTEGIQLISKHRSKFKGKCQMPLLPNYEASKCMDNKWDFVKLLTQGKMPIPNTSLYSSNAVISYPTLMKPLKGRDGNGIFYVKDKTELQENLKKGAEYLVQEYIDGWDVDCSFLAENGKVLAYTVQKAVHNNDNKIHFKATRHTQIIKEERVYVLIEALARFLKWEGVAHVDLRYCKKSDSYYILELNPRYWSSLMASKKSGVNFAILSLNKETRTKGNYENIYYYPVKVRLANYFRLNFSSPSPNVRIVSDLNEIIRDPIPYVMIVINKIRGMF